MIIVTNSLIAGQPLVEIIDVAIAKYSPKAIYLREKHLTCEQYLTVAKQVKILCDRKGVELYICHFENVAKMLGIRNIHISVSNMEDIDQHYFDNISVATHSEQEALYAESCGASSIMTGHIFATSCKPNLEARGVEYLRRIVEIVDIPVNAIGGINASNVSEVMATGANDYCIMQSAMLLNY